MCAYVCVCASVYMSFLWMPTSSVGWPATVSSLTSNGMSVQLGVCVCVSHPGADVLV